ncbi:hypothetical protein ACP4I1_34800 [Streptomyces sp. WG4]|uniref:hypothetical protein n=1 Tax=Streptomyces sp. WG4 TaxID=3417649 RepID=UPI003CE83F71
MSDTRVPPHGTGSYPAPGLAPEPGRIRNQALVAVGAPFLLVAVLVVAFGTAGGGSDTVSSSGGFNGGTLGGAFTGGPFGDGTDDDSSDDSSDETDGAYGTTDGLTGGTTDGTSGDTTGGYGTTGDHGLPGDDASSSSGSPADDANGDEPGAGVTAPAAGPEATVTAYFDAINDRDFRTAWELGGKNIDPDYDHFAEGFDTTESDELTVHGTTGDTVYVTFVARQTDGSEQTYDGSYTVRDGLIVSAVVQERG